MIVSGLSVALCWRKGASDKQGGLYGIVLFMKKSKRASPIVLLVLCTGLPATTLAAWGTEPDPVTLSAIEEVLELNDAPQTGESPPGTTPPEAEPYEDGYTDKEREEAAAAALTDPRAEMPDQILNDEPDPPPPPQTEGVVGEVGVLVRSFAGIDAPTSGRTIPDVSIARSYNRVLQATNAMLRLTETNGTFIAQMSMDAFFGLINFERGTTDPKVYFDALGPKKAFVIAVMGTGTPKVLHLAVSRSPDPENLLAPASWCRFKLTHPSSVPQAGADYPNLGAGPEHLILTSNHFDSIGSGGTLVRLIAKDLLYNNPDGCPLTVASTAAFPLSSTPSRVNLRTLQPVQFVTAPGSPTGVTTLGYLVSAIDYGTTGYNLWSLQRNSVGALVTPLRFKKVDASKNYLLPPPATQPPGLPHSLNTGDGRVLQAVGVGNSIWFTQTTGCNNSGTGVNESCANAMQLNIVPSAGVPVASFGQQRLLGAGAGVSLWQPSIAMTPTGHVALMYHQSSASLAMSLRVAIKRAPTTSTFRVLPLDTSACSNLGSRIRTGDYLGAQVDPSGTSFWLAGEKLIYFGTPPQPRTCRWASYVKEVRP